jgi:hypothetical protein
LQAPPDLDLLVQARKLHLDSVVWLQVLPPLPLLLLLLPDLLLAVLVGCLVSYRYSSLIQS